MAFTLYQALYEVFRFLVIIFLMIIYIMRDGCRVYTNARPPDVKELRVLCSRHTWDGGHPGTSSRRCGMTVGSSAGQFIKHESQVQDGLIHANGSREPEPKMATFTLAPIQSIWDKDSRTVSSFSWLSLTCHVSLECACSGEGCCLRKAGIVYVSVKNTQRLPGNRHVFLGRYMMLSGLPS